ncbi:MAG: (2Fe-2S) ferredoxin domain-containing protein [Clostridia bacterium]|nr:(2Fe-2S) ferredoxin domain-containing protein [Clostridia bacterium]MBQ4629381.1 (2Fe-2S) ferredoxin domain-containing protein [Clostridia bacterium]
MKSLAELEQLRNKTLARVNLRKEDDSNIRVVVGMATCGIAAGARPVMKALMDEIEKRNISNCFVTQTGCIGVCRLEPIVEVYIPGSEKITYVKMDAEKAVKIVNETIVNGKVINEYTIGAAENN